MPTFGRAMLNTLTRPGLHLSQSRDRRRAAAAACSPRSGAATDRASTVAVHPARLALEQPAPWRAAYRLREAIEPVASFLGSARRSGLRFECHLGLNAVESLPLGPGDGSWSPTSDTARSRSRRMPPPRPEARRLRTMRCRAPLRDRKRSWINHGCVDRRTNGRHRSHHGTNPLLFPCRADNVAARPRSSGMPLAKGADRP